MSGAFDELPNPALLNIFTCVLHASYPRKPHRSSKAIQGPVEQLCAVASVCRSWRSAAHNPFLWKRLAFAHGSTSDSGYGAGTLSSRRINDAALTALVRRAEGTLRVLDFSDVVWPGVSLSGVMAALQQGPQSYIGRLSSLRITGVVITSVQTLQSDLRQLGNYLAPGVELLDVDASLPLGVCTGTPERTYRSKGVADPCSRLGIRPPLCSEEDCGCAVCKDCDAMRRVEEPMKIRFQDFVDTSCFKPCQHVCAYCLSTANDVFGTKCGFCNIVFCEQCAGSSRPEAYCSICGPCGKVACPECAIRGDGFFLCLCSFCGSSRCYDCAFDSGGDCAFCWSCNHGDRDRCEDCFPERNLATCAICDETWCNECCADTQCRADMRRCAAGALCCCCTGGAVGEWQAPGEEEEEEAAGGGQEGEAEAGAAYLCKECVAAAAGSAAADPTSRPRAVLCSGCTAVYCTQACFDAALGSSSVSLAGAGGQGCPCGAHLRDEPGAVVLETVRSWFMSPAEPSNNPWKLTYPPVPPLLLAWQDRRVRPGPCARRGVSPGNVENSSSGVVDSSVPDYLKDFSWPEALTNEDILPSKTLWCAGDQMTLDYLWVQEEWRRRRFSRTASV